MAGRLPLYTDADIHGPVVEALTRAGWDVGPARQPDDLLSGYPIAPLKPKS